jgi:hypothetical protein
MSYGILAARCAYVSPLRCSPLPWVKNLSSHDCTISGHPWIRLGPIRYPVTVEDATRAVFGWNAGKPGQVVTLRPGERAFAAILDWPGCGNQAARNMFAPWMRFGWADRSVKIGGWFCKNGGIVLLGSFQRHSS